MTQHRPIQLFFIQIPLGHKLIHAGYEFVVGVALNQVYNFMNFFLTFILKSPAFM
jgi:hypothetical protein